MANNTKDLLKQLEGTSLSGGTALSADKSTQDINKTKQGITRDEAKLGKPHKNSPTVLSRIFDVLSRGNYAVANATHEGKQKEKKIGAQGKLSLAVLKAEGSGFLKGLEGKKKTTFSKVLKEDYNVKNKLGQGLGGLALDVATDPTNLVGLGVAGKVKDTAELATHGAQVAEAASKSAKGVEAGKVAIQAAQRASQLKTVSKGISTATKASDIKKELRAVDKAGRLAHGNAAGDAAIKTAKSIDKPSLALKIAGVPVVKSEKAYQLTKTAKDAIGASNIGSGFRELLDPTFKFGHGTNPIKRRVESASRHFFEKEASEVASKFHKLNPDELDNLKNAVALGHPLMGASKHGHDLNGLSKEAINIDKSLFERAKSLGLETAKAKYDPARRISEFSNTKGIDDYFVHRIAGIHNVEIRKNFITEISDKFGVKMGADLAAQRGFVKSSERFAPKGIYFHPEIAESMKRVNRLFADPDAAKRLLKTYDSALSEFKTLVTVVNPGHHVQNLLGDVSQSFVAGVNNPLVYKDAVKAVRESSGKISIKGINFTGKDIAQVFNEVGGDAGLIAADFLKKKTLMGRLRSGSQIRENYARLAHFIDILKKSPHPIKNFDDLKEAGKEAVQMVNKFHFDYGDKTKFEKDVMSRVIPFYTWVRKNLPNQLENLVQRPGRIASFNKAGNAISASLGQTNDGSGIIPQYVREAFPVKVGANHYFNPNLPITDLGRTLFYDPDLGPSGSAKEMLRRQLGNTTPAIKDLVEWATGKSLFSGAPLGSDANYLSGQIPVVRLIKQYIDNGDLTQDQILNYLTSAGSRTVNSKAQLSELKRIKSLLDSKVKKQKVG